MRSLLKWFRKDNSDKKVVESEYIGSKVVIRSDLSFVCIGQLGITSRVHVQSSNGIVTVNGKKFTRHDELPSWLTVQWL